MAGAWFETVAEAQRRAKRRLPPSVYCVAAGRVRRRASRLTTTWPPSVSSVSRPTSPGWPRSGTWPSRSWGSRWRSRCSCRRPGSKRSTPTPRWPSPGRPRPGAPRPGLSSFASKPIEEVVAANPQTFFQLYWCGTRERIAARIERARSAGAVGLIVTLDWSFSNGRDWGSPTHPRTARPQDDAAIRPRGAAPTPVVGRVRRDRGQLPDLTVPNMAAPGEPPPTFFGAYGEWMQTPPPTWDDVAWLVGAVGWPIHAEGAHACRRREAGGRRRRDGDLRVQPRWQQPGRHPGDDPRAPGHRGGGRRQGRRAPRRRDPARRATW